MNRFFMCGKAAFVFAFLCLTGAAPVLAQADSASKPRPPDYARLESARFTLNPWEVLEYTRVVGFRSQDKLDGPTLFLLDYSVKNWPEVWRRLQEMPTNLAERVYGKILSDLNAGEKPPLALDDVIAIMDLCPSDLANNSEWLGQVAGLIKGVTAPAEVPLLGRRLEQGTRVAGGKAPDARLLAGRILLRTDFADLAKSFLPSSSAAAALPAGPVRDEILKFYGVEQSRQQALEAETSVSAGKTIQTLINATQEPNQWQSALHGLRERMKAIPAPALMAAIRQVLAKDATAGQEMVQAVLQRIAWEGHVRYATDRMPDYLQMQQELARLLAATPDIPASRRDFFLNSMADTWIEQAGFTLREKPEFDKRRSDPNAKPRFVSPELLIATAPGGEVWLAAIPPLQQERIQLLVPRLQMCGDEPDKALATILDLSKRSPQAAGMLASEFVHRWAEMHDPRISDPIRQRYQLAAGTAIVVTPIMVRKNVAGLASMMELLRRNNIAPADYREIFEAFDFCYGNADVYQVADIEKVFGPVGDMPDSLFNALTGKMQENLGTRWRSMATQQAALYNRGQEQLMGMIRRGYADAIRMLDARVARRPDEWKSLAAAGTLLSDWGDLEYFQELTKTPVPERTRLYKEKNLAAQDYFLRGCQAYARAVPALDPKQYAPDVFLAWFNSLLGLNSNGEINLSKAMNREALARMGDVLRGLPAPAAEKHMALFGKAIDARLADTAKPVPPEMKFKYIASGLVVTAGTAQSAAARNKLEYYNDLLSGVRVETRVDGSNTIWRKEDFGIIVSLAHSEFMGRLMKMDKYVLAQPVPNNKGAIKRMGGETTARNELERSILESLTPFFEIKSVTFSPREVLPRAIAQPGWQETVLAYAQVRAKDISVDRVPPIEMKLDYVDLDGPVQIPATSAETLIRLVGEQTPPRPCGDLRITQSLDLRPADSGAPAKLTVTVSGSGLMPELEELLDLAPLQACLPVKKTDSKEGALVKSLQSWSDKVQVTSERQWALTLDSAPLRETKTAFTIVFPAARDTNAVVRNEVFQEENLVAVADARVTIPAKAAPAGGAEPGTAGGAADTRAMALWIALGAGALAVVALALVLFVRSRRRKDRPPRIDEVFPVPAQLDGFSAVRFLRNLAASELAHWHPEQKAELAGVIARIEQTCFDPAATALPAAELHEMAKHWLRQAR
ncbi:MAG: hypothetical protein WCI17_07140 [bacterium]